MKRLPYRTGLICALLGLTFGCAQPMRAAEQQAPSPSKEMRQQMAAMHEKMAMCLRSDKLFAECRAQMQKECQTSMGEQGCMMMGHGMGMGMGTMRDQPKDSHH